MLVSLLQTVRPRQTAGWRTVWNDTLNNPVLQQKTRWEWRQQWVRLTPETLFSVPSAFLAQGMREAGQKPAAAKLSDQCSTAGLGRVKGSPDMATWFPDKQVIATQRYIPDFTTWTLFAVCRGWSFLTAML